MGSAQTGTGKTAAFVLPILQLLLQAHQEGIGPRCLVVAPTRNWPGKRTSRRSVSSSSVPRGLRQRRGLWPSDSNAQTSGRCLDCDSGTIVGSHGARSSGFSKAWNFCIDEADRWTWGSLAIYEELWPRSPNSDRPCCFPRRWKDRCCEWPNLPQGS